jgi:hypothetical protein
MEKVTLFLLLAIAINGIALYYQLIQRPGHILFWWRRLWGVTIPSAYKYTSDALREWFKSPGETKGSKWWEWVLYFILTPVLLALFIISMVLYKLRKPLVTCIHCNIFWVSLITYLMVFGTNIHLLTFFGTVYVILLGLLSLPYLKDKFE